MIQSSDAAALPNSLFLVKLLTSQNRYNSVVTVNSYLILRCAGRGMLR